MRLDYTDADSIDDGLMFAKRCVWQAADPEASDARIRQELDAAEMALRLALMKIADAKGGRDS
jgi:hypothetical protein